MFRSLVSYIFVREFLVHDVLYLQNETSVRESSGRVRSGKRATHA